MMEAGRGKAGSTLDASLAEEGILDEATEHAIKGVLACQIDQEMMAMQRSFAASPSSSSGGQTNGFPKEFKALVNFLLEEYPVQKCLGALPIPACFIP